ncbi:unnamed protein product, partial [Prorocentrum cordatum]
DIYSLENPSPADYGPVRTLCLGAPCSVCGAPVCAAGSCSLFYSARFCRPCAAAARGSLPSFLDKDLQRLLGGQQGPERLSGRSTRTSTASCRRSTRNSWPTSTWRR